MDFRTSAKTLQGTDVNVLLKNIPDVCPRCHRSIHPKHIINTIVMDGKSNSVQAIFMCTSQQCQEVFIGNYRSFAFGGANQLTFNLVSVAPISFKPHQFPETIKEVSPTFIEIYNQALSAESYGLTEIVGIGLRKALEFLIKDFIIKQNPTEADSVKAMLLGRCIESYIDDANLKACSKRAAWLGNDETHYIRKWEGKDINDLKTLIQLTVNWVENVILTKKYIASMTPVTT